MERQHRIEPVDLIKAGGFAPKVGKMKIATLSPKPPAKQHEAGKGRRCDLAGIAQVDDDSTSPRVAEHLPGNPAGFLVGQSFLFGNDRRLN